MCDSTLASCLNSYESIIGMGLTIGLDFFFSFVVLSWARLLKARLR